MSLKEKVQEVIEKRVNPGLAMDGGSVELVNVDEDGVVSIRMLGHCAGCPMRQYTISSFVEKTIKDEVPEVTKVVSV